MYVSLVFSNLSVLASCFPELNVPVPPSSQHARGYWKDINNQRAFLERIAKELSTPIFTANPMPYSIIYRESF